MHRGIAALVISCFCASPFTSAQDFKILDREVALHGFVSQGFVYTNTNNWLTMDSNQGSPGMTEFGFNLSTNVTDKLRVGAQLYDRNLGQLGQYHPSLDWAVADYRFASWFGIRGGKVKTALGLYTDTQDLDFLRVFALLPQSIYPTDLRDATIAHLGGDIYGSISLKAPSRRSFLYGLCWASKRQHLQRLSLPALAVRNHFYQLRRASVWRRPALANSDEGVVDWGLASESGHRRQRHECQST
jgi:hypothetical protein